MATALRSPVSVEQQAADHELRAVLEEAIAALPTPFRTVFMLRDVEELSTAETAAVLETNEQTVKTRLHRARAVAQGALQACRRRQHGGLPVWIRPLRPRRCGRTGEARRGQTALMERMEQRATCRSIEGGLR